MDRPLLTADLTGAELRRWYWLRDELAGLARDLGVPGSGAKLDLLERVAAALDGLPVPSAAHGPRRVDDLPAELTGETVLQPGQACTQRLRAWFVDAVGPGFRFDAAMRGVIARGDLTLDEAVARWHVSRRIAAPAAPVAGQFELNRFTRAWRREHPGASHSEVLDAWAAHRALPREQQPAVPD